MLQTDKGRRNQPETSTSGRNPYRELIGSLADTIINDTLTTGHNEWATFIDAGGDWLKNGEWSVGYDEVLAMIIYAGNEAAIAELQTEVTTLLRKVYETSLAETQIEALHNELCRNMHDTFAEMVKKDTSLELISRGIRLSDYLELTTTRQGERESQRRDELKNALRGLTRETKELAAA